jgi:predicted double-glycine peptidase
MVTETKFKLHKQEYDYSCGPASLQMLYEKFGLSIAESRIIEEMGPNNEGYSWNEIKKNIGKQGLRSQLLRDSSFEELLKYPNEIVCYHTNRSKDPGFHYSLVLQIDDNSITLADPNFGDVVTYGREQFMSIWHDEEGRGNFLAINDPDLEVMV